MRVIYSRTIKFLGLTTVLTLLLPSGIAKAANMAFTDLGKWSKAARNVEPFDFTDLNVSKANELGGRLPEQGTELAQTLTFENASLSRGFRLTALQSGAKLVFNDSFAVKVTTPVSGTTEH